MFREPDTQTLKCCYDHGVQISGVERSWTTALVHNVTAHRANCSLPVRRINTNLHLKQAAKADVQLETSQIRLAVDNNKTKKQCKSILSEVVKAQLKSLNDGIERRDT